MAFDLVEGGVLCRSCRRGRPISAAGLDLLRRTLGGGLAGVLAEPRSPVTDEVTALATEAMEAHLDRRLSQPCASGPAASSDLLRRLRPRAVLPVTLRLLRLCHLHRPRPPDGGLRRRLRDRDRAGPVDEGHARRPPRSSSAGARPSRLPADLLVRHPRRRAPVAGAEVTVECNPEDAQPERLAGYRAGGGDPDLARRAVDGPRTCSPASAGATAPSRSAEAAAAVAGAGFAAWNMDLIIGGAGETDGRLGRAASPTWSSCPTLRPTSAPTPSPWSRAPRWPPTRPGTPTTTSRPTRYERADAGTDGGRLPVGGDLQLGPARPRVPPQPPLLGPGGLPGHRVGGPLPPGRPAVVERAHARPVRGRGDRGRPRPDGRRGGADRRPARASKRSPSRCAPGGGPGRRPARRPRPRGAGRPRATGRAVLTVRGRLLANAVTARSAARPADAGPPARDQRAARPGSQRCRRAGLVPAGTMPPYA